MKGVYYNRYGPGRLPYASRKDVGGGIIMASAVLLSAAIWYAGTLGLAGIAWVAVGDAAELLLGIAAMGLPVLLVSTGAALGLGTFAWRYALPETPNPRQGVIAGGAISLLSLVAGTVALNILFQVVTLVMEGLSATSVALGAVGLVTTSMGMIFGALAMVGWLAVPVGALVGWYYEGMRLDQRRASTVGR